MNIEQEIKELKSAKGFMVWFNDFQIRNCKGCRFAVLGEVGVGELCCEFFDTRRENGICLDRESL